MSHVVYGVGVEEKDNHETQAIWTVVEAIEEIEVLNKNGWFQNGDQEDNTFEQKDDG